MLITVDSGSIPSGFLVVRNDILHLEAIERTREIEIEIEVLVLLRKVLSVDYPDTPQSRPEIVPCRAGASTL